LHAPISTVGGSRLRFGVLEFPTQSQ
jgi:hypothetical protein